MDFITKLPLSKEPFTRVIYNTIWVIVDKLTKQVKILSYKEGSIVDEFVYEFRRHIFVEQGISKEIISNQDKL